MTSPTTREEIRRMTAQNTEVQTPKGREYLAIECKGGYLRITDPDQIREYERLSAAKKAVKEKGFRVDFGFSGIMGLAYCPVVRVKGVNSLRKFHRLFTAMTGQTRLTYYRQGRRITSSEFEFEGLRAVYDGREHRTTLKTWETVHLDFMPGEIPGE